MARPSAAAALLLLLLSLLAVVAHCRPTEPQSATDDAEPAAAIVAAGGADDDENGPPNPTLPAEEALPAEEHGFLRLPSHRLRRHCPCRHGPFLHRHHLWWARHHGAFGDDAPAPRRFHFHHRHGDDEALIRLPAAALPLPADEVNREAGVEEVKAVAEPDPDRSLPDGEPAAAFADADGAHEAEVAHRHEDDGAAVTAWKKEMLRRWLHFHHRHGMRLHHRDDEHEQEEEDEAEGLKRFHHHDEDEEKHAMRKRFRLGERDDGDDSDDEDEEVEEMVRRFRKAIMRRRFGHGRRFHRHHHVHRHAEEEAEKADAQEEGGVVAWIKGLVNRF